MHYDNNQVGVLRIEYNEGSYKSERTMSFDDEPTVPRSLVLVIERLSIGKYKLVREAILTLDQDVNDSEYVSYSVQEEHGISVDQNYKWEFRFVLYDVQRRKIELASWFGDDLGYGWNDGCLGSKVNGIEWISMFLYQKMSESCVGVIQRVKVVYKHKM